MNRLLERIAVVACIVVAVAGAAEAADPAARESEAKAAETQRKQRIAAFTADAVKSLERSAAFLAKRKTYSFEADVAWDVMQANGQMLEFGGTRDFLARRPDRMRIESIGRDGEVTQLFFDGENILIDLPREDAYVKVAKPGTLYAAFDYLVEDLGIPSPLEDFAAKNYADGVRDRIESGFYVQHVQFGERVCEQLAFRTAETDVQLWVQTGDEPLPCRVVITYKNAPGQPQFTAQFSSWNLSPESDDGMFEFSPPESAERIQVQALAREARKRKGAK